MFIIPYNTDAPIYHYPFGTLGLIIVNIVVFSMVTAGVVNGEIDDKAYTSLCLEFGKLQPHQWVTSNFMHAGILHLLGNMLFLWGFGLVVEGKLGWYLFVPIYLLIGATQCAAEQVIMLGADPAGLGPRYSLGASAAIFGILGLALVWAPKNEMKCLFIYLLGLFIRTLFFDISIIMFATAYVLLQIVFFALGGFNLGSAALHLMGFAVGFPLGFVLLKTKVVECENWDLISVLKGTAGGKSAYELRAEAKEALENMSKTDGAESRAGEEEQSTALTLLRSHLDEGRPQVAYAVFRSTAGEDGRRWEPPQKELLALIRGMHQEKMWSQSIPLLLQVLRRFPEASTAARLRLAQILVQVESRPKQALAVLSKLPGDLPPALQQQRSHVEQLARANIEEGDLELEIHDW